MLIAGGMPYRARHGYARWINTLKAEWLLIIITLSTVWVALWMQRVPRFTVDELQVLFILFVFLVIISGIQRNGVFTLVANYVEQGRHTAVKLVLITFLLAMLVTNDVSLLILVSLTVSLRVQKKAWIVALEAVAANAGAALTPIGAPQNLFIYWLYGLRIGEFVRCIWPLAGLALFLVLLAAWIVDMRTAPREPLARIKYTWTREGVLYLIFLMLLFLVVAHLLPLITALIPVGYALIRDRRGLRVDYPLLITFVGFFGLTDNLSILFATRLIHVQHLFLTTVALSQVISNVPTTLLFVHHTRDWCTLLWGATAGGFGSLVGSLANVIAYRIYVHQGHNNSKEFLLKFSLISYTMLAWTVGGYILCHHTW